MGLVLMFHSLVRWLILLVAVIAIAKFATGWFGKKTPDKMDRGLMSGFSGLMDLQTLLGLIFITTGFTTPRIEHFVTMVLAVALAHLPMRWRKNTDTNVLRNNLFVVVGVIVLVVLGISVLPGNRWDLGG